MSNSLRPRLLAISFEDVANVIHVIEAYDYKYMFKNAANIETPDQVNM